ncbi:MAG TPA: GYF domain-containing protein [Polyangiaceae bacterium]|nr:GYF domain-containing protein [Polyangiaceae bacterium]
MSDATDDASRWSWVTPDGKLQSGAKGELMLALRSEKVPPRTLVWRPTWAEWLPASRVAELAGVLPPSKVEGTQVPRRVAAQLSPPPLPQPGAAQPAPARGVPVAPPGAPGSSLPPPAPVRNVGAVSRPPPAPVRGKNSQPPGAAARGQAELPRPHIVGARVPTAAGPVPVLAGAPQARPRGASILGPPRDQMAHTEPSRAPLPTLGGEEGMGLGSTTLRPPGAVPPPPRAAMGASLGSVRTEDDATPRRAAAAAADTVPDPEAAAPTEIRPGLVTPDTAVMQPAPARHQPRAAAPAALPASLDFDVTLGSTPFESAGGPVVPPPSTTLESSQPAAPAIESGKPASLGQWLKLDLPKETQLTFLFFGAVLVVAVGVLFLFIVTRSKGAAPESASSAAVVSASAAPAAPDSAKGCRLLQPAARLATAVERSVQPAFAELARGERVAVGFAPNPKGAAGLLVRLDTLDVERPFEQGNDSLTRSTVPIVSGGKTTFYVDHADSELAGARTLSEGVTLGFAGPDLVRVTRGQKTALWPGAAAEKTTDPHVASAGAGTLVTFRRGGLTGQVLYGWIGKDGGAAGLVTIEAPGVKLAGTPDAAASNSGGLVAFAGRPNENADWRIQLAKVPAKGKASARTFEPPPGGAGGGNIAPSVTPFGDDGWLLQWTEGASGRYQVRLARLGPDLEVYGDARLVSPKGANAGQGAVFATGTRVLAVFVQTTAGHDELWGASFECL